MSVTFSYEAQTKLRLAFLGTSGHAFRNFLPCLPYLPVELVGLWDPDAARAEAFARQFGAEQAYSDLDQLIEHSDADAVLIGVDDFDGDQPRNASLMNHCLEAGLHVWTDKPVAATREVVEKLIAVRDRVGRVAAVGIKTMFNPAYRKAREIVRSPGFGQATTFTSRYPLYSPARAGMPLSDPAIRSCLGHIWHPVGTALVIVGPIRSVVHEPAAAAGGGVALVTFANGVVGTFHFSTGQAGTSPLERVEVVGEGSNVMIDNACRLTWYRQGSPGPYGRTSSYFTADDMGPLVWEPEMSLGQLYNNNNFVQGYAQSLMAFVDAARDMQPLQFGTLEDALEVLTVFEMLKCDR